MSRDSKPSFKTKYIRFVIVMVMLSAIFLGGVYVFLRTFQGGIEKEKNETPWLTSQRAFEEYAAAVTAEHLTDLWYEANPDSFDDETDVKRIMTEALSAQTSYARAKDYTETAPAYVIENDSGAIVQAYFARSESGEWVLSSEKIRIVGEEAAEIKTPSGCTVLCNGKEVGEQFCDDGFPCFYLSEYESELKDPVLIHTWRVSGQLTTPELTVVPPSGTELYEDDGEMRISISEEAGKSFTDIAEPFFQALQKYGILGYYDYQANAKAAADMCRVDSQAYNSIYEALDAMSLAPCYGIYEIESDVACILKWAENAYTVDFTFHSVGHHGIETQEWDGGYRILLMDLGDGFEIVSFINN